MGGTSRLSSLQSHEHVDKIFDTMDLNRDGLISMDEFLAYCTTSKDVRDSMMVRRDRQLLGIERRPDMCHILHRGSKLLRKYALR